MEVPGAPVIIGSSPPVRVERALVPHHFSRKINPTTCDPAPRGCRNSRLFNHVLTTHDPILTALVAIPFCSRQPDHDSFSPFPAG